MQFTKSRVLLLVVLAVSSAVLATTLYWIRTLPSQGPSPVYTSDNQQACTYSISLNGTTPVARVGLSRGRTSGDSIVGTIGEDMASFLMNLTRSNAELCFTTGIYSISTSWSIGDVSNFTVTGVSGSSILFLASGTARHLVNIAPSSSIARITFSNMIFDGNAAGQTDASSRNKEELVEVLGDGGTGSVTTISFLNNEFRNTRGGAALQIGNEQTPFDVSGIFLRGNNFHDNGGMGGAFPSDDVHLGGCTSVTAGDNIFDTSTDTGLAIDSCSEISETGNIFRNNSGQGASWTSLGNPLGPLTGFSFTGNNLVLSHALNSAGLTLGWNGSTQQVRNPIISGNVFDNTAPGSWCIYFRNNNDFPTITGNTFFGGGAPMYFEAGGGATNGVLVDGNTFYGMGSIDLHKIEQNFTFVNNQFRSVTSPFMNLNPNATLTLRNNNGYNPVGKIGVPFATTTVGLAGTRASPLPNTTYLVNGVDLFVSSSGGTAVSITIDDNLNNTVQSGLSSASQLYVPIGYKINFGAFTSTPTVTVFGN